MPQSPSCVQNFKGKIKAFQNVCAHRFNRIQPDQRGNA
jgi:phenylpropionate dioxygenase-like ring-hydroxylating dioxygenase large terminal subunit